MNPYAKRAGLFYGREALMREMLKNEQRGQSVVLVAGKRCGKTRLLERIHLLLASLAGRQLTIQQSWMQAVPDSDSPTPAGLQPPHWPILINFQGIDFDGLKDAFRYIASTFSKAAPPEVTLPPVPSADDFSGEVLEDWLRQADGALGQIGLGGFALLLDEIEEIFGKPWHHDLMSLLRRLDDGCLGTRIWIVISGSDVLHKYSNNNDGSPPLNTTQRTIVRDLGYRARRRMTIEPFARANRVPPSDTVLREIDRLGGGHPWILTHLLGHIYDTEEVTPTAVDLAAESLIERFDDVFDRWEQALTNETWKLYGDVATHGHLAADYFTTNERKRQRRMLEMHSLVHARVSGGIEIGPELFRKWAEQEERIRGPFVSARVLEPDGTELPVGSWKFDVALSYSSLHRDAAQQLATMLQTQKMAVFYDKLLAHDLWGVDLARCLPSVYDREAQITILLLSEDYVHRRWPKVEAHAALEKAMRDGWDRILIVSLDGTRLPDIPDSIVCMDLSNGTSSLSDVALALVARLND